jgi:hypothetical protein
MRGLGKNEIERIFQQVEAFGWLIQEYDPRKVAPPQWRVNPEVHRKFKDRAAREVVERSTRHEAIKEMGRLRTREKD